MLNTKIDGNSIIDFLQDHIEISKKLYEPIISEAKIEYTTHKKSLNKDTATFYYEIQPTHFELISDDLFSKLTKEPESFFLLNTKEKIDDPLKISLSSASVWTIEKFKNTHIIKSFSDGELEFCKYWKLVNISPFFQLRKSQELVNKFQNKELSSIERYILFGEKDDVPSTNKSIESFHDLNKEQLIAFNDAISSKEVTIIKGPPGTGKTTVIEKYIEYILTEEPSKTIAFATNLHSSIEGLIKKINKNPTIKNKRIFRLSKKYGSTVTKMQKEIEPNGIAKCYISTLSSQRLNTLMETKRFLFRDLILIIDEASATNIFSVLAYTTYIKKIIIIGDDNQLSPIFNSDLNNAHKETKFKEMFELFFKKSLFNHLIDLNKDDVILLRKNYRSVKEIVDFINVFYQGKLLAHNPPGEKPFQVIGVEDIDQCFQKVSTLIVSNNLNKDNCIFMCDYKRVVMKLNSRFKKNIFKTITSTQGDEADYVVLLLTKNEGTNNMSSQLDFRTINVAISRAKKRVYIIHTNDLINKCLIDKNNNWNKIIINNENISIIEIFKKHVY